MSNEQHVPTFGGFGNLTKAAEDILGKVSHGGGDLIPDQLENLIKSASSINNLVDPISDAVALMKQFQDVAESLVKLASAADDLARIGKAVAEVVAPLGKKAIGIADAIEDLAGPLRAATKGLR